MELFPGTGFNRAYVDRYSDRYGEGCRWWVIILKPIGSGKDGRRAHVRRDKFAFEPVYREEASRFFRWMCQRSKENWCIALVDLKAELDDVVIGDRDLLRRYEVVHGIDPLENLFTTILH